MRISAVCFTKNGEALGEKLTHGFGDFSLTRCSNDRPIAGWTKAHFSSSDALVFIGATGIAVRSIAPYVVSKTNDPAVIVIDDGGTSVIPLLSGHIGGANALAKELAQAIGANAIITTSTDIHGVFAIDTWAAEQGFRLENPEKIKVVSSKLLDGAPVALKSDFPVDGALPSGMTFDRALPDIVITFRGSDAGALNIIPPCLSLGIGCRKGTPKDIITAAFFDLCKSEKLNRLAFQKVFSIDMKKDEDGILAFCKAQGLPFQTFTAEELQKVQGSFAPSSFVKKITGTDNVCERSAVLGSGGKLLVNKTSANGITLAVAISSISVTF